LDCTFIVLIPKSINPQKLLGVCDISLVMCMYTVLSKVCAKRAIR